MPEDKEKQESETSVSASEENKTQETTEDETSEETDSTDYKAEFEKEKTAREEAEKAKNEAEKAKNKAEGKIVKMKNKFTEEGIEFKEDETGMDETRVQEIAKDAVSGEVKTLKDELAETKQTLSEMVRAGKSDANKSTGASPGQKKAIEDNPPPTVSKVDQKQIDEGQLKWDKTQVDPKTGKKGVWVGPSGKVRDTW